MEINKISTNVEKCFNFVDSLPLVSGTTSEFRVVASLIQMLASIILGVGGLACQMFSTDRKWENLIQYAKEHLIHGALNFIRGIGESLLAITIVGSLGLFAYQVYSKNKFNPIYKYSEPQQISQQERPQPVREEIV